VNYRIKANQGVFDAAVELYGDVGYSIKLMLENTTVFEDINTDVSGQTVEYDENFKPEVLSPLVSIKPPDQNLAQIFKPYEGQTIFDIALMLDGTIESIAQLISASTLDNINSGVYSTSRFEYTKKSSALLDWIEKTGQVFKTQTPITGLRSREHDRSFDSNSHT
jgi:hypothetical protein